MLSALEYIFSEWYVYLGVLLLVLAFRPVSVTIRHRDVDLCPPQDKDEETRTFEL